MMPKTGLKRDRVQIVWLPVDIASARSHNSGRRRPCRLVNSSVYTKLGRALDAQAPPGDWARLGNSSGLCIYSSIQIRTPAMERPKERDPVLLARLAHRKNRQSSRINHCHRPRLVLLAPRELVRCPCPEYQVHAFAWGRFAPDPVRSAW